MDVYQEIVRLRQEGRRGALATIIAARGAIPSFTSAKMLVREDGSICGTVGGGMVEALVIQTARKVMAAEKAQTLSFNLHDKPEYDAGMVCGGALDILIEPVLPPPVLYIFGAGHIGLNVYKAAHLAGFDVIVIDERQDFANRERFPDAREVIAVAWDDAMARVEPGCSSFVVIVTPGHQTDTRILSWAVDTAATYVGMVGSRRKVATVFKALQELGVPKEVLGRVHAPIGLDIGAITPEEIAVSVLAEIVAVRRQCPANLAHMRDPRQPPVDAKAEGRAAELADASAAG